jgi:hypothetical protein
MNRREFEFAAVLRWTIAGNLQAAERSGVTAIRPMRIAY